MTAVALGQHGSPAEGPGPSLCRCKYFYDFTAICQKFHSNGYHGTAGRTTGFWSGRYWFESQPSHTFLIFTTENLDAPFLPPPLIHKLFRSWISSETQRTRVPLRNFSVLRDKEFSIENLDFPLLGIKFFDTRNFLKHRRVPLRSFSALWDKNFLTENRDTF